MGGTTDFESRMYATVEMAREYMDNNPEKPYILCEYSHAMGNSCGNLSEYVALADEYPQYCGGFGDRLTDYNFCADGIIYGDRKPSPKMQEVKFLYQSYTLKPDIRGAVVKSRALFSDGSQYNLVWKLEQEGQVIKEIRQPFALEPGGERHMFVPGAEESILCPDNEYVITASLVLAKDNRYGKAGDEIRIVGGDCTYSVMGDDFSIQYNKRYGRLSSLKYGGREMIHDPLNTLLPNFWRAPVDNDEGNEMKIRCSMWKTASLYPAVKDVSCEKRGNLAVITASYELGGGAVCTLRHEVSADGTICVTEDYMGAAGLPDMPCFGVSLKLSLDFNKVGWYGLGPDENYIDRMQGAKLGYYEITPEDNISGYVVPQECGNRAGVRWFTVCDKNGLGIRVEAGEPFEFSALPYTCHELEHARHHYELPKPYATVLRINRRQMGVGGDNSWGARPHSAYTVSGEGRKTFRFSIKRA